MRTGQNNEAELHDLRNEILNGSCGFPCL